MVSFAYPIDRLDWSLFSAVIVFYHWFPLLDKIEIRAYILPRNFPAVLIIFTGRGRAGNPPFPTVRDGAGNPPLPAGRGPRGAGRPSLEKILLSLFLLSTVFKLPFWGINHHGCLFGFGCASAILFCFQLHFLLTTPNSYAVIRSVDMGYWNIQLITIKLLLEE